MTRLAVGGLGLAFACVVLWALLARRDRATHLEAPLATASREAAFDATLQTAKTSRGSTAGAADADGREAAEEQSGRQFVIVGPDWMKSFPVDVRNMTRAGDMVKELVAFDEVRDWSAGCSLENLHWIRVNNARCGYVKSTEVHSGVARDVIELQAPKYWYLRAIDCVTGATIPPESLSLQTRFGLPVTGRPASSSYGRLIDPKMDEERVTLLAGGLSLGEYLRFDQAVAGHDGFEVSSPGYRSEMLTPWSSVPSAVACMHPVGGLDVIAQAPEGWPAERSRGFLYLQPAFSHPGWERHEIVLGEQLHLPDVLVGEHRVLVRSLRKSPFDIPWGEALVNIEHGSTKQLVILIEAPHAASVASLSILVEECDSTCHASPDLWLVLRSGGPLPHGEGPWNRWPLAFADLEWESIPASTWKRTTIHDLEPGTYDVETVPGHAAKTVHLLAGETTEVRLSKCTDRRVTFELVGLPATFGELTWGWAHEDTVADGSLTYAGLDSTYSTCLPNRDLWVRFVALEGGLSERVPVPASQGPRSAPIRVELVPDSQYALRLGAIQRVHAANEYLLKSATFRALGHDGHCCARSATSGSAGTLARYVFTQSGLYEMSYSTTSGRTFTRDVHVDLGVQTLRVDMDAWPE